MTEKEFDPSIDLSKSSKILILGGGCYGSLFSSRMARARKRNQIEYAYQLIVDINPECEIGLRGNKEDIIFSNSDWMEFLTIYFKYFMHKDDYIVMPCNTPHFIFRLYTGWLAVDGKVSYEVIPFNEKIGFKFEKNGDEVTYVSIADWQCPPLCREPQICPATHQPRTWDVKKDLMNYLSNHDELSSLKAIILESERYVNGVAIISAGNILDHYHAILNSLNNSPCLYLLATLSQCHGAFSLLKAKVAP